MATSEQNPYQAPREGTDNRDRFVRWRRIYWLGFMALGLLMVILGIEVAARTAEGRDAEDHFSFRMFLVGVTMFFVGTLVTFGSSIGWLIQIVMNRFRKGAFTMNRFWDVSLCGQVRTIRRVQRVRKTRLACCGNLRTVLWRRRNSAHRTGPARRAVLASLRAPLERNYWT